MIELKKQVFKETKELIFALMDLVKAADKTGELNVIEFNKAQAEANEKLNNHFIEFEKRHQQKKGIFG